MGTARDSQEFKAEAVRLFKAGNKPGTQLAKEFGVAAKSIRDWAWQADVNGTALRAVREKLVHYSDRGIQDGSNDYQKFLDADKFLSRLLQ